MRKMSNIVENLIRRYVESRVYSNFLINFAGLPAYTPLILQLRVTTLPAPITQPDIIFTGKIVELLPIKTLSPITVENQFSTPPPNFPFFYKSFVKITP